MGWNDSAPTGRRTAPGIEFPSTDWWRGMHAWASLLPVAHSNSTACEHGRTRRAFLAGLCHAVLAGSGGNLLEPVEDEDAIRDRSSGSGSRGPWFEFRRIW